MRISDKENMNSLTPVTATACQTVPHVYSQYQESWTQQGQIESKTKVDIHSEKL